MLTVLGFFISAIVFYALNFVFPPKDKLDQYEDLDVYGTFTPTEARRIGIMPLEEEHTSEERVIVGREHVKV